MSRISELAQRYGTPEQISKYSKKDAEPLQIIPFTNKKELLPVEENRFLAQFVRMAQSVVGGSYDFGSDENKERIRKLVLLFNSDKPINKFIVLSGKHGTGKTTLMITIAKMLYGRPQTFGIRHTNRIINEVKENDYQSIKPLEKVRLCLNDFGFEDEAVKRYGNTIDPIDLLVYNRWECHGLATYFTTNIQTKDEFISRFSRRTAERIAPQMIFVTFNEKNHRINGN